MRRPWPINLGGPTVVLDVFSPVRVDQAELFDKNIRAAQTGG
jgi:hypothetical protein